MHITDLNHDAVNVHFLTINVQSRINVHFLAINAHSQINVHFLTINVISWLTSQSSRLKFLRAVSDFCDVEVSVVADRVAVSFADVSFEIIDLILVNDGNATATKAGTSHPRT